MSTAAGMSDVFSGTSARAATASLTYCRQTGRQAGGRAGGPAGINKGPPHGDVHDEKLVASWVFPIVDGATRERAWHGIIFRWNGGQLSEQSTLSVLFAFEQATSWQAGHQV